MLKTLQDQGIFKRKFFGHLSTFSSLASPTSPPVGEKSATDRYPAEDMRVSARGYETLKSEDFVQ